MNPSTRRRKRLVAAGVVAASLSVAGAGAAMAANSATPAAVEEKAASQAPPAEAAATPVPAATGPATDPGSEVADPEAPDLTEAQSNALWEAGYTPEDIDALGAIWATEWWETKARLGQMVLDGVEVPIAPGSTPSQVPGEDQRRAFWRAGYTYEDAEALAAIWGIDSWETKARAGQALMDGETLPIAPGASVTP